MQPTRLYPALIFAGIWRVWSPPFPAGRSLVSVAESLAHESAGCMIGCTCPSRLTFASLSIYGLARELRRLDLFIWPKVMATGRIRDEHGT
jgi:hypothetical protein